ncbi:MAG TPA: hypothetical protein VMZ06_10220 [Candidatus Bathyarchaeia archaeon]|nr:hypothetical protein [Candidatus Bathyarchaeia archaeon]
MRTRMTRVAVAALFLWAGGAAGAPESLSRGLFEIQYAAGNEALAERTLDMLEDGLDKFSKRLPGGSEPIRIFLCANYTEFVRLAGDYGRVNVGGIARSEQGLIVLKPPELLPAGQDYGGMVRHELLHVLLARNTEDAYVPRWFNEGVAMVISKELRWESGLRIARMYVRGRVIPYANLNFAFAPVGDEGVFDDAYAQALSLTRYLMDRAGEERFWALVSALKTTGFEDALPRYTGFTPATLYDGWRRSLWKIALLTSLLSGFSAFQLMAFLVIVAYLRKRHLGRKTLRRWEEEENEAPIFRSAGCTPPEWWESVEEGLYPWEEEYEEKD